MKALHIPTILWFLSFSGLMAQTHHHAPTLTHEEILSLEAGEIIIREVKTGLGEGLSLEAIAYIKAPGEKLMNILTDYQTYPEFMSAVGEVQILDDTGRETILNYILKPILGVSKRYRLKMTPSKPDSLVWKLAWEQLPWPGLKPMETLADTRGHWLIIQQSPKRCLVKYYVYSDPGPIPFGLGGLVNMMGESNVTKVVEETRHRAE